MTETRAEKAQRLVDEGGVNIVHTGPMCIQASVHSNQTRYSTIIYRHGTFWCTCEHGLYHAHTDDLCAHALAVKLAVSRDDEAERAHSETLLNALDETWGV